MLYTTCPLNPVNLLINSDRHIMQAQELKGSDRFQYSFNLYYKKWLEIFKENLYVKLRGKYIFLYWIHLYIRG